jgi:hypothetical protein
VNYWKVILATVVIFGTGVFTGGLLVNFVDHSHPKNFHRSAPAATNSIAQPTNPVIQSKPARLPEILSRPFVEQLSDELQLTPAQRAAIETIIAESQGQMRKAVQAVRQGAREKIREQLDPAQQKHFDELMKRPLKRLSNITNAAPVFSAPTNAPATNAPGI